MKKKISFTLTLLSLMVNYSVNSQTYYSENFENQPTTVPTNNGNSCSNATWPLSGGLINTNDDDIEWIVLTGTNIIYGSSFPLIDNDHTTGTSAGKYICISESDDCFNNLAHLETANINLTNAMNPQLTFWFHMWDEFINGVPIYGSLNVDVYSNGNWINNITPTLSGDFGDTWNQVQVDLSAYAGQNIKIRFKGVTGDFSYVTIALDDVLITEPTSAPTANIGINAPYCQNGTVFIDSSANLPTSWNWNFGANATPQTAVGPGPHSVTYNSTLPQTVTLIVSNIFGNSTATQIIQPVASSSSNFSWTSNGQTVTFSNSSSNANSMLWSFGDGSPSVITQNPSHSFANSGTYDVTLYATNECGTDSLTQSITVSSTSSVNELNEVKHFELFPNPTSDNITISNIDLKGDLEIQLLSVDGRLISMWKFTINSNTWSDKIEVSNIPEGSYILKFKNSENNFSQNLIIQ